MANKNQNRAEREHRREEEAKAKRSINKILMWLGVIIIIALLLYWLFAIGTFEGPNQ